MKCPVNGTLVQSKGLEHAQRMYEMFGYSCVDSDYKVKGKQIVKIVKEPTKKEK